VQVEGVEESEVDKAEDGGVELDEDRHQAHVHTSRLGETKTMRDDPSHSLTFDFSLEIVALDATKDLPQGARLNDIVKELCGQAFAERHHFHWSLLRLGEGGVEEGETEAILEVPDRVYECGIALLDDRVQVVAGLVLPQPLDGVPVFLLLSFFQFPEEDFEISELVHYGLVQKKPDIFFIVQRGHLANIPLLSSFPVPRLTRENSFQNTQTPKVLQRELELLESALPGHEVGGLPRLVFLLAVAHLRPGSI